MGTKKSLDLTELFYKKSETRTRTEITNEIDQTIRNHEVIRGKVNTSDIIDDLIHNDTDKPLSANQGKNLKTQVDTKASNTSLNNVKTELKGDIANVENEINSINTTLNTKVDKIPGKSLSSNDYTTSDKEKLANIDIRANRTIVDDELNPLSTNPVQNAVICAEFYNKDDIIDLLNNIETGSGKLLSIYIDEDTGDLVVDDDGFHYYTSDEVDDGFTIDVTKQSSPDAGYFATYVIKQGGIQKGVKINIPKDFLLKSASVKTSSQNNNPIPGINAGDKYIDFVLNVKEGTSSEEHLYLNLHDLTDIYTADEVTITCNNNQFSIKEVPVAKITGVLPANQVTHQDISGKVNKTDIQDNLTSTAVDKPLSANQGKLLQGNKLDKSQGSNNASKNVVTDSNGDISFESKPIIPTKISDLTNDSEFVTGLHGHGNISSDGKVTTTASNVDKVVVTDSNGVVKVINKLPANNVIHQDISSKEDKSNKTSSWNSTPDNTKYPTEKLVKDNLDTKIDTAGTGLSKNGTTLNHSNTVNAQSTPVLKKIQYDAQGHITGVGNVSASDLPNHTHNEYLSSEDVAGKMDASDYGTVNLAVVFEDNTNSTYKLLYEK